MAMDARETDVDDLIDRSGLCAYLAEELSPADQLKVVRHTEGHSNETLFVSWDDRELVLRRPPPGETADTAHDVLREYAVLSALQDTAVPVPTTVLACEDHDVIGCPFFLMERLHGDVIREAEPARFRDPAVRERIGTELVDTLAAIHDVAYEAVGLDDYGRPDGYLERQVELWTDQLEGWLLPRTEAERTVPGARELGTWLAEHVPSEADHTLVHGDYKLDNVMIGPENPPEIAAVFDWEMSTLGDPLADLGYLLLFWRDGDDHDSDLAAAAGTALTAREGYPSRAELVDRYERRSGRAFRNRRFYRALAAYKLATACEAFFYRHLSGAADDPLYPQMEAAVPALISHGQAVVDGERPL